MSENLIECLGCHRGNVAGTRFCSYCRRRLHVPDGWDQGVATRAAEPPKANRSGWLRRSARPTVNESELVVQRLRRYTGSR